MARPEASPVISSIGGRGHGPLIWVSPYIAGKALTGC